MNTISEFDYAVSESQKADMKQHADKILQGLEKITDAHAIRAIWELVQNARDISKNCEITFDFSSGNLIVTHNGNPFSSKSFISLIKQVSSKPPGSNDDSIGQFGTGFITTHSFGKTILLSSTIQKQNGKYIHFEDFEINREAMISDELSDKLYLQQEEIYRIVKEEIELDIAKEQTVFKYVAKTDLEIESVKRASNNIDYLIPYVLVLNQNIKSIRVVNHDDILFERLSENTSNGLTVTTIKKGEKSIDIHSLESEDKNVRVILPLEALDKAKLFDERISKLFLFFPLMGTEKFGFNFIIHSKLFAPTEPRDGVHLNANNDQTKLKVESNKELLETASDLIFSYVKKAGPVVENPIVFSKIDFFTKSEQEPLNDYFKGYRDRFVSQFSEIELVECGLERLRPSKTHFIALELFRIPEVFPSLFKLIKSLYVNIPNENIALQWTTNILEWEANELQFVTIKAIVNEIVTAKSLDGFDKDLIKAFYNYLIDLDKSELFEENTLLPNIKGVLLEKIHLKATKNIDPIYIGIADEFIPQTPKQFINNEFKLALKFDDFSRSDLSKEFNSKILSVIKEVHNYDDKELKLTYGPIVRLCSIFSNENVASVRRTFVPKVCQLFNIDYKEFFVPNIEEDKFDYDTPFKLLVRIFLNKICENSTENVNWVQENLGFLIESYDIIHKYYDVKELFESAPIIPNQNYVLRSLKDLLIEEDFLNNEEDNDYLKDLYKKIDSDIRASLVHREFERFIPHANKKTALELSSKIEDQFKLSGSFDEIESHPYKKDILDIIVRISNNNKWSDLFNSIEGKKALIMMQKISNPEVKDGLFNIISLPNSDIKILGELSRSKNLALIISLGRQALEEKNASEANFEFKKKIGVHIEGLIRENLKYEVAQLDVRVVDEQGGQDITISLNGEVIYYVEVKSRWDKRNSIFMSNLQLKRAKENKDKYALCSVDMTEYAGEDRYEVKDLNEILDNILFVDNIGEYIEPLIDNTLNAEVSDDNVRLTDYRAIIPQSIIKEDGDVFKDFVNKLCIIVKQKSAVTLDTST